MRTSSKWFGRIAIIMLSFTVLVPIAHGFAERSGQNVTIDEETVVEDDIYLSGETVTVDGTIKGDLYAAGRDIIVNGTVTGDIVAAGQSITINGEAQDDVRIAGAALIIGEQAAIADDLIAAGYSLEVRKDSTITGNLAFGGKQAFIEGHIASDLFLGTGGTFFNGSVDGDANISVGSAEKQETFDITKFMKDMPAVPAVSIGLTMGDDAAINGDLTYRGFEEVAIDKEHVRGTISFDQIVVERSEEMHPDESTGMWLFKRFQYLVVLALLGGLILWVWRPRLAATSTMVTNKPLASLGWGIGGLIGFPVLLIVVAGITIVLAFLLGGPMVWLGFGTIIPLAIVYLLVITFLTQIIMGYFGGGWLLSRVRPQLAEQDGWRLVVGLVIVVGLTAIPYAGAIIQLTILLFGLGALILSQKFNAKPM